MVLLDELGSGTDPEEGSALSMAVIDHLIEQGSTVLATTHLTVLKHYGYTKAHATNASMAFDEATHRPTYRVVAGQPGMSHAVDTAEQQGLPPSVLARARNYLQRRESSVSEIINRLSALEKALAGEREEVSGERQRLRDHERELSRERERIAERERQLRREGLVEIDRTLREARKRVEGEVRRLRERGGTLEKADIQRAHAALHAIEEERENTRGRLNGRGDRRPTRRDRNNRLPPVLAYVIGAPKRRARYVTCEGNGLRYSLGVCGCGLPSPI